MGSASADATSSCRGTPSSQTGVYIEQSIAQPPMLLRRSFDGRRVSGLHHPFFRKLVASSNE
jgi:hypothetical protein